MNNEEVRLVGRVIIFLPFPENLYRHDIVQNPKSTWVNCTLTNDLSSPKIIEISDLVGNYYEGDGTGENQFLSLLQDAEFNWQWRGCLRVYGTASGTWQSNGDVITLTVKMKTGYKIVNIPSRYAIFMREGSTKPWK